VPGGLVAVVALAVGLGACSGADTAAGDRFTAGRDGVLTVATAVLPAPGLWEPDGDGGYRGFEAGLADALAEELDAGEVRVVEVPFTDLVAGRFQGADLAISALTPTDEREAGEDFTAPYLGAPQGVLARPGAEAGDAAALQELRWVVVEGSTLTPTVEDRVRPERDPVVVEDRAAALAAVRAGEADAVLLDLPVAQAEAAAEPDAFAVAGQLGGGEGLAVALPEGSDDLEAVDAAVRRLRADGTVEDLEARWFGPAGDVPLIRLAS
jgi:polar amino acid transport system substrate-binding protein